LSEAGELKTAKLTSFGLTDFLAKLPDLPLDKANLLHKSSLHKVNVHYSAAEIHNYSLATDVYSFGVLLMVMALNKEPPKTDVLRQSLLELIKWESLQHIIRQCINRYHNLRPSISKVHDSLQKL
jgi:serine/threonine protein kinase